MSNGPKTLRKKFFSDGLMQVCIRWNDLMMTVFWTSLMYFICIHQGGVAAHPHAHFIRYWQPPRSPPDSRYSLALGKGVQILSYHQCKATPQRTWNRWCNQHTVLSKARNWQESRLERNGGSHTWRLPRRLEFTSSVKSSIITHLKVLTMMISYVSVSRNRGPVMNQEMKILMPWHLIWINCWRHDRPAGREK